MTYTKAEGSSEVGVPRGFIGLPGPPDPRFLASLSVQSGVKTGPKVRIQTRVSVFGLNCNVVFLACLDRYFVSGIYICIAFRHYIGQRSQEVSPGDLGDTPSLSLSQES
jgi:hypothetical protein